MIHASNVFISLLERLDLELHKTFGHNELVLISAPSIA
jgi:hypothetical protein